MAKKNKKQRKPGFISRFISSEKGQRFFNFAYSIGAAIVIWGALFKILHLPGGNTLLSIGMGTEVLMFLLTAFDRPPKEYKWEEVFPQLDKKPAEDSPEDSPEDAGAAGVNVLGGSSVVGGGTVIIGHGAPASGSDSLPIDDDGTGPSVVLPSVTPAQARASAGIPSAIDLEPEQTLTLTESIAKMAAAADQLSKMAELTSATQRYLDQIAGIATEMERLRTTTEALNNVSSILLQSYDAIAQHSTEINESSTGYVEQMQDLNRNISGLNTIYEIQLKSVSSQLDAIDRVNRGIKDIRDMYERSASQSTRYCEETEKMARYMHQLNSVYEKMITAMTINMYRPMMGVDTPATEQPAAPAQPRQPEQPYE